MGAPVFLPQHWKLFGPERLMPLKLLGMNRVNQAKKCTDFQRGFHLWSIRVTGICYHFSLGICPRPLPQHSHCFFFTPFHAPGSSSVVEKYKINTCFICNNFGDFIVYIHVEWFSIKILMQRIPLSSWDQQKLLTALAVKLTRPRPVHCCVNQTA